MSLWIGLLVVFAVAGLIEWMQKSSGQAEIGEDSSAIIDYLVAGIPQSCDSVHLIVLVPGLLSPPNGLGTLRLHVSALATDHNYRSPTPSSQLLIYRANSNLGEKTKDGILVCGRRLADEVNQILHRLTSHHPNRKVTLSFLGNSLGGLISRAALPLISWHDNVTPKLFYTTNTPHMGSRHALHVQLPPLLKEPNRFFLSWLFGKTGRDLFLYTDTIRQLNSDDLYLKPLGRFAKRVSYSNAFQTDLQVPTPTSAFLVPGSDSPHHSIPSFAENFPFVVHAVVTPRRTNDDQDLDPIITNDNDDDEWMLHHCRTLDGLGWTKVFCDTRPVLPSLPLPFVARNPSAFPLEGIEQISEWTADHLHRVYCRADPERWYPPLAHKLLLATPMSLPGCEDLSLRGLPFVEEYARRIVRDVLEETTGKELE